jgi:hypothetical protein
MLNLSHNAFSGEIPTELGQLAGEFLPCLASFHTQFALSVTSLVLYSILSGFKSA